MGDELRRTGIKAIGDSPWGTHFCHFYETKEDLLDILVPYFTAGLESNELCVWVVSAPLTEKDVREGLGKAVPRFDEYLATRSLEILSAGDWYLEDGVFDLQRVTSRWMTKLGQALARGYDGLRGSGNTAWLERNHWDTFHEYEKQINDTISGHPISLLCTYALAQSGAAEVLDVASNHQAAIAKRHGQWVVVETPDLKQTKTEIKRLNDELEQRVIERTSELHRLSGRLLRFEDEERRRLARELHDSTAQQLAALAMNLSVVSEEGRALNPRARKALTESVDLADASLREIRTVSYLLHPPELDEFGLRSALARYVDGFVQRCGIQVELDASSDLGRLPQDMETTIFRIVQECLTNIHRHSGSGTASIRLVRSASELILEVRDAGVGMRADAPPGVGIASMRERLAQLGGRVEIGSHPGGTTIKATIPLSLVDT